MTKIKEEWFGSEAKPYGLVQGFDANAFYAFIVVLLTPSPFDTLLCLSIQTVDIII